MNSDRGNLFRQERTDPARNDQPALSVSSVDALMELIVAPRILERAWRQVKRNRGAPGPDGMTTDKEEKRKRTRHYSFILFIDTLACLGYHLPITTDVSWRI
jgi:hypothetical protein